MKMRKVDGPYGSVGKQLKISDNCRILCWYASIFFYALGNIGFIAHLEFLDISRVDENQKTFSKPEKYDAISALEKNKTEKRTHQEWCCYVQ